MKQEPIEVRIPALRFVGFYQEAGAHWELVSSRPMTSEEFDALRDETLTELTAVPAFVMLSPLERGLDFLAPRHIVAFVNACPVPKEETSETDTHSASTTNPIDAL